MAPRTIRRAATAALFATGLLAAAPARANGRFPSAQSVVAGPGGRTLAMGTTFGVLVSDDGGAHFAWICEGLVGGSGVYDPLIALDRSARVHVGVPAGLTRVAADRCSAQGDATLMDNATSDVDATLDGASVMAVTSAGAMGAAMSSVFRSDDGGESFRRLASVEPGTYLETVEMARGDTQRVYLTAAVTAPFHGAFLRSDDGGQTLRELPFGAAFNVRAAFIAGIDPTDRDTVYVRVMLGASDGGAPAGTALLQTTDGGASFREIARTTGPMLGFALSDDGQTIWIGGNNPADGLQRSDDRGQRFARIGEGPVLCLRQREGTLFMCSAETSAGFALGRSTDGGRTFTPVLRLSQVPGPAACPADAPESTVCTPAWPAVHDALMRLAPADAGAADVQGADAVAMDAVAPPDGGDAGVATDVGAAMDATGAEDRVLTSSCACRAHSARGGRVAGWLAPGIAALWTRIRARARARARRRGRIHPQG